MAFNVTLYSGVDKRVNSTKLPTGSGSTYAGVLKDGCSVMRPVVLLEAGNISGCNYAHISEFGRYYFITDIVSINNLWEVHMRCDPMATYRSQISSLIVYAERSDHDFDGEVMDTLYPGKTTQTITDIQISTSYYNIAPDAGSFVLGVINRTGSGQAGGAITYYAMTPAQMRNVMAYLLSSNFLSDNGFPATMTSLQQITQDVAKCIVNPMTYIASCFWFPYSIGGTPDSFTLGYWDTGSNTFGASKMSLFTYTETITATIPQHPQAATRGSYLNHAPYTELALRVPPFGVIPLNPDYITATGALTGSIFVDVITGKGHLRVSIDNHYAAEDTAMFGVPIQISQVSPDWLGALSGTAAGIGAIASGNIGGLASIGNSLNYASPTPKTQGINGSFLTEIMRPYLSVKHTLITDERRNEFGRPLCQNRTVDTIPGYIKCGAVPDTIPGTAEEKEQIRNYMMEGFFFE